MVGTLALLLVCATPEPVGLAITPLTLVDLKAELGGYAEERLSNQLGQRGYKVTAPSDIQALIGLERQKQLLGQCDDSGGCMTEIGAALGVPLVVVGRLSKLGGRVDLDLRVLRQRDGTVVARDTRSAKDVEGLGPMMDAAAAVLAEQLAPKVPFPFKLVIPLAVGAVAMGVGAALWVPAELEFHAYTTGSSAVPRLVGLPAIDAHFAQLSLRRNLGIAAVSVGAALVTVGVLWNALVPEVPITVTVVPSDRQPAFALGGRF